MSRRQPTEEGKAVKDSRLVVLGVMKSHDLLAANNSRTWD